MKKIYFSFFVLSALINLSVNGQVAFSDKSEHLTTTDFHSGAAMGVVDMNGDGLDDIVRLNNARQLSIEYQTSSGEFQNYYHGQVSNNNQWSLCVADVDQNGYNDILMGGSYDGVRVLMANATGSSYLSNMLPGPNMFLQGSNFVDINNDGFVDVFGCHDDAESRVWGNDGGGIFFMADDWIDASTTPASDNSGNYGSIWTDFDNDGDQDMYVANGGPPEAGPKDPPVNDSNALFRNDGGGAFTEITTPVLILQDNSRSVTWADFDNDGDLDLFVTTGSFGANLLFENTPDGFVPLDDDVIGANGRTRDAAWGDFDNDGHIDLYLSRLEDNRLVRNNGDGTFSDVTMDDLGNAANGRGVAWADYDDDGDLDLFNATTMANTLFRNDTVMSNSWLKVRLVGTVTNRDAIGARVYVRTGARTQMREVAAGEGYLSQRPLEQHFGLGPFTIIDEVRVEWPVSGRTQRFFDVVSNQTLLVTEPVVTPDLNGDGVVNGADLAVLLSAWGTESETADLSGDGAVDGVDLALMLAAWGTN